MARSPLTLAASVTSALPHVVVTGVAALTEGVSGRYDSAIAELEDGRRVVVRIPADDAADADLRAESRALTSLTAGVRAVLPFGAPDVLGQTVIEGRHTLVQTLLPGYRVDAAHVPAGRGIATALGAATAQVHDLPVTVIRDAALAVSTAGQVRSAAERLLDEAEATGLLPFGLLRRWSTAVAAEALWRFETTVVLGGVEPSAFVFEDDGDGVPRVTGLLSWGGLSVGDPAVDLRWTAAAPAARPDVLDAYTRMSHRAPDPHLEERARLHAELEFARWLVHGHSTGASEITADALALLESLDESVRDQPAVRHDVASVDEAIAAGARVPAAGGVDTSMHTDTFDPDTLARFLAEEGEQPGAGADPEATAPIELSEWTSAAAESERAHGTVPAEPGSRSADEQLDGDVDASARNALRRWSGTA